MKQGFYQYYKLTVIWLLKKRMIELNEMDDILSLLFSNSSSFLLSINLYKQDTELQNSIVKIN